MNAAGSGFLLRILKLLAASGAIGLACAAGAADNPAEAVELTQVDVIGTTPLPGLGTPVRDVPANVQVFTSEDLARQRGPGVVPDPAGKADHRAPTTGTAL